MIELLRQVRTVVLVAAGFAAVTAMMGVRLDLVLLATMAVGFATALWVLPDTEPVSVDPPGPGTTRAGILTGDSGDPSATVGPVRADATAITWWNSRLAWLQDDPSAFATRVQPRLAAMIETRLRLRHGFDYAADPQRAQLLIGPELAAICAGPLAAVPTPTELSALVDRIEQL